ncbi:hypothetical protein ACFW2O_43650, partial [Streptomyces sp. NPDC058891]
MPTANYRPLLRTPGAAAFFLPASLGRVGVAMTGLSLVRLVHSRTGNLLAAGQVSAAFAVAEALGAPQLARLADRFGAHGPVRAEPRPATRTARPRSHRRPPRVP